MIVRHGYSLVETLIPQSEVTDTVFAGTPGKLLLAKSIVGVREALTNRIRAL
jgi:hypothetical protein